MLDDEANETLYNEKNYTGGLYTMRRKMKKLLSLVIMICVILVSIAPVQTRAAKADGSKKNPYSAYKSCKTEVYGASYAGEFKIKLVDYKDGKEALKFLKENGVTKNPGKSKEYVYLKFKIKCLSADEEVPADLILNDYWSFFDSKCRKQLKTKVIPVDDGNKELSYNTMISPGETVICSIARSVKSGSTPITYRIAAGYDEDYNEIEKWFTTKK